MSKAVSHLITYDIPERDKDTGKMTTAHKELRPCGGFKEAESTRKNLELNKSVRNLKMVEIK